VGSRLSKRRPGQKQRGRRQSLIPARPSRREPGEAQGGDATGGGDVDADTQVSLPAFGEDGEPISDVPPPPIHILGATEPGDDSSAEPEESSAEPEESSAELEHDAAAATNGDDDAAEIVDEPSTGPTVSVDGSYSIPPESISSFADLISEEEQAEEYRSRGEIPASVPPSSGVDDFLTEGYFEAVEKHVGATDDDPGSLVGMFDDMDPPSQAWWDGEAPDEDDEDGDPKRISGLHPQPEIAELQKDLAVGELLRASLRPPPEPEEGEEEEIEFPRPAGLPKGVTAGPVSRSTDPGRRKRGGVAAKEERPPSRALLYVAGIIVAGGVGWYLAQRDGSADDATATTVVTHTVVVERTVAANPTDDDEPDDDPGAPADSATASVPAGQVPGGGPWAGAGAAGWPPAAAETTADTTSAPTAEPSAAPTAEPSATATAEPAAEAGPFDRGAARAALSSAAGAASGCGSPEGISSKTVTVSVTFAPSGRVTTAMVAGGPYAGTPQGSCIASAFRAARVPPFEGSFVTVSKTVRLQ
jgi:hypothetical protein